MSDCVPARAEFKKLSRRYNLIPIYREWVADLETPVSCFLKVANQPFSFLLESVEGGEKMARFSFIGIAPSLVFKAKGRNVTIRDGAGTRSFRASKTPLDELEKIMRSFRQAPVAGLPPFSGGAVGFMGYDTVRFFEKLPDKNPDKYDPELARQKMAHLLFNMSPDGHQRVVIVVGIRAYLREAELQAANLREMASRLREIMVKDRANFEAEYMRLVHRIFQLSEQVEDMKLGLKSKQDIRERVDVELKSREGEKAKLLMTLAKAKADTDVALEEQAALEKYLFQINTELGRYKDYTEKLERELRALEVRGNR